MKLALQIIDRYILSRFLFNFFSSFAILMFIFIFQTIWLFIDDLAGKDLDIWIIGKFLLYYMPTLIDKVLPLTVLLSSILTFGTFAENYEFAAMKASGISLQKAMRSIVIFVILLGVGTFFLSNNVIPASEQKIFNMRRNIAKVKPAAVIVEGVFSDIEGSDMNIKVDKKSGEKDRLLDGVVIHQKNRSNINTTVIKAKDGELVSDEESDIIQLVLNDGNYYEERVPKSNKEKKKYPFTRAKFDTYIKNIDVSSLNNQDFEQETDITTDKMKNIFRLNKDIDSLKDNNVKLVKAFSKNIITRMGVFPLVIDDSVAAANNIVIPKTETLTTPKVEKTKDSIASAKDLLAVFPEWQRLQLLSNAKNSIGGLLTTVRTKKKEMNKRYEVYNRHILSLHKKFAFAFSCIILFFVGAPLGAIIRKGGLGLPMVIAIVLFLTYHFIGVFADNSAKKGAINPMFGAWLSTLIMLPLGVYLTKRATADKGLMSFGNIADRFTSLFKKKRNTDKE
ncbi:MAG: YjgP/YjgQ family permease [Allomuricauda sp.]|nr:MAG: YjgP/YjgQ family permease [Allomuricauda sp.]